MNKTAQNIACILEIKPALAPSIFRAVYSAFAVNVYSLSLVQFWPGENNLNIAEGFLGKQPRKVHHGPLKYKGLDSDLFWLCNHKISIHARIQVNKTPEPTSEFI